MHRLIRLARRARGMGPTTAEQHRAALEHIGRAMVDGWAEGVRNPRPLTAEEMDHVLAYAGAMARRAFPALYDDED